MAPAKLQGQAVWPVPLTAVSLLVPLQIVSDTGPCSPVIVRFSALRAWSTRPPPGAAAPPPRRGKAAHHYADSARQARAPAGALRAA